MNPKISVIMPAYNVEKYILRSVRCIIGQTFTDYELIIIDDGSSDTTPQICDELESKYNNIRVYHKENGGVSEARNCGLDILTGDYLTFIDSDDLVAEDYLQYLYTLITRENNIDIAMTVGRQVNETEQPINIAETESRIISAAEAVKEMLKRRTYTHANWGKLYRSDLWKDVRFPVSVIYDDYDTTYRAFANAERVVCGNAVKYSYLQRTGSLMHAKCSKTTLTVLDVADEITEFISDRWPENQVYAVNLKVATYMKNLQAILNTGFDAFPQEQERIEKTVKDNANYILKARDVPRNDKIKIISLLISKKLFLGLYNRFDGDLKVKD